MTVQTATSHGGHHLPLTSIGVALAGIALAGGTAFGLTQMLSSSDTVITPEPRMSITDGARDSWEGRIGPAPAPGTEHGVRDSWMPPGTTDQSLAGR